MQGSVIAESVLASAVGDADIVLEAVVEDVQVKKKLIQGTCMCSLPIDGEDVVGDHVYRHSFIVLRGNYSL